MEPSADHEQTATSAATAVSVASSQADASRARSRAPAHALPLEADEAIAHQPQRARPPQGPAIRLYTDGDFSWRR